ncbi:glycosyltransferase family 1 protein [Sphingomonas sp. NBWT7]|uniref:glycosyltransferase family 4 protein n=1 Tax=Sphingomonas sp. NBWT7 TaxID=2596913 RepID=UPI00215662D1|nr:glycosyltransferase family 1 protein [Sphingomonas sp. NBWT7]
MAEAVRALGLPLHGIFGMPVGRDPRLREILYYEALGRGLPPRRGPAWARGLIDRVTTRRGLALTDIPQSDAIERQGFADRLPTFDRLYSAAFLFERADRYFRRTQRLLEVEVSRPPAIMHWTYPVPVRIAGARNIYTLHDLVPLKLPFATLDRKRLYFRLIERCIAQGDHVVTVSESSRRDIIDLFGANPDRITNTYQHAPVPESDVDEAVDVGAVFGLPPGGYFLYFGAIEPKKNIARLIEAYLSTDSAAPLVIVGARGWQQTEELRLAEAIAKRGGAGGARIVQLDYLPRRLLMHLVANARAVVFPSLYEGFGLPVLEAMQRGVPVITSDRASLPEVAGDAALLIDPYDVGALAGAIRRIDASAALRLRLSAAGYAQSARYGLDAHRRALHALYTRVLEAPATHGPFR